MVDLYTSVDDVDVNASPSTVVNVRVRQCKVVFWGYGFAVTDPLQTPRRVGPGLHRDISFGRPSYKNEEILLNPCIPNEGILRNGRNVRPSPELVEAPVGQSNSKSVHDGPSVGDIRTGNRLGDGVHARNAGSIFQEDDVAILDDLAIGTLNGQEIIGSENGEGKKSKTNERID